VGTNVKHKNIGKFQNADPKGGVMNKISNRKQTQIINKSKGVVAFPIIALIWIALNAGYMIYTLVGQMYRDQQHATGAVRHRDKQNR